MHIVPFILYASSLTPSEIYQATKAKRAYRETHPECAMCGNLKYLEVHHVEPVHTNPARAADPTNLITLCDGPNGSNSACHRYFGHFGNFRNKWNPLIREQCVLNRFLLEKQDSDRQFYIPSEMMLMEFAGYMQVSVDKYIEHMEQVTSQLYR